MAVGSIRGDFSQISRFSRFGRRRTDVSSSDISADAINDDLPAGRALLAPVQPVPTVSSTGFVRPAASFVAHLIAMADRAPQTRERNRASGFEATSAYRGTQSVLGVSPRTTHQRMI